MRTVILLLLFFSQCLKAQTSLSTDKEPHRFNIEAGLAGRVTVFYTHGTKGLTSGPAYHGRAPYPYTYLKGVNGYGINLDLSYNVVPKIDLKIHLFGTIRYDHFKFEKNQNVQTIYVDQGIFISKSIFTKFYVGAGYTIYNIGKELNYRNGNKDWTLPLEFNSMDFLIGFPVWKINIEPKISVVSENFPGTIKDNATLLGLRIYYRFLK